MNSGGQSMAKYDFNANIWIADENGNIYYIVRDPKDPTKLQGLRVSTPDDKWNFRSTGELNKQFPGDFPQKDPTKPDGSVAIVKMLLAMGVTAAAIPKDLLTITDDSGQVFYPCEGTSYVINLASFDKTNVFWPDDSIKQTIEIKPHRTP